MSAHPSFLHRDPKARLREVAGLWVAFQEGVPTIAGPSERIVRLRMRDTTVDRIVHLPKDDPLSVLPPGALSQPRVDDALDARLVEMFHAGLSYAEIGSLLGLRTGSVGARVQQLRKRGVELPFRKGGVK